MYRNNLRQEFFFLSDFGSNFVSRGECCFLALFLRIFKKEFLYTNHNYLIYYGFEFDCNRYCERELLVQSHDIRN